MRFKQICAWILLYAVILAPAPGLAAYPPTTTKSQLGTKSTTFNFQAPNNQITKTDSTTALIETGNDNMLSNPDFEANPFSLGYNVTISTPSLVAAAGTNIWLGKSATWDPSAASQSVISPDVTITNGLAGNNCEASVYVKVPSGNSTYLFQVVNQASAVIAETPISASADIFTKVSVIFVCPTTGTIAYTITSQANEPLIAFDHGYIGLARSLATVGQATFYGSAEQRGATGCEYSETTSTGLSDYVDLGTAPSCPSSWSVSGPARNITAVGITSHQVTLPNMPPGEYKVEVSAGFAMAAAGTCNFQFSDGTNTFGFSQQAASSGYVNIGSLLGHVSYTTTATRTFKIQASDTMASCGINNANAGSKLIWRFWRFPSQAELAVAGSQQRPPNYIRFTANGTYVPTQGVVYAFFRVVGGGGGGGSSGTAAWGAAQNGFSTSAGTIAANGGQGANTISGGLATGGTGGGGSLGPLATGKIITGNGGGGATGAGGSVYLNGGLGGASCLGGRAPSSNSNSAPVSAIANSGSGGAGAGSSSLAGGSAGAGGGAGGCVEAYVSNLQQMSIIIGNGGVGGAAGTGGSKGGDGANGSVEIIEYFGATTALLANSVSIGAQNGAHEFSADFTCSPSSAIGTASQPGASIGNISSGVCVFTFPSGMFSTKPWCNLNWEATTPSAAMITNASATSISVGCFITTTGAACSNIPGVLQCKARK